MNVQTFKSYFGSCRIEVFIFQFANLPAVDRISPFTTEFLHVKMVGPFPDLLVRSKTDTYLAMFDFRVILQIFHSSDDGCHTAFIVGSQQGLTVGYNNILVFIIIQFRKHLGRKNYILFGAQDDISSFIIYNPWSHIFSRHIRTGIQMGDKADSRNLLIGICRKCCHQIAVFIQRDVFQTYFFQFLYQFFCKHPLSRSTWCCPGLFTRLCFKRYIL